MQAASHTNGIFCWENLLPARKNVPPQNMRNHFDCRIVSFGTEEPTTCWSPPICLLDFDTPNSGVPNDEAGESIRMHCCRNWAHLQRKSTSGLEQENSFRFVVCGVVAMLDEDEQHA